MRRTLAATAVLALSSAAYGATSSTPSISTDLRVEGFTGCEITSNSGQPLLVTVVVFDADGRQRARARLTLAPFSSRIVATEQPVDGFHCRFVVDGGKVTYVGAAKYLYISPSGELVELGFPDR